MTNEVAQQPQEQVGLTITDLSLMKEIIDLASSRAAFKPAEMAAVGQTYAKLTAFLEQVAKQQAEAQAAEQTQESTQGNE